MSVQQIAPRYARALFQLANEQKSTAVVGAELVALRGVIDRTPELAQFLTNAAMTAPQQRSVLQALFQTRVSPLVKRLLDFLVDRRRVSFLGDICAEFDAMYRRSQHILSAHVSSAFALRPEQVEALRGKLETKYHEKIDITVAVDPALLGGFSVRVRDTVHDCSVKGRLAALHAALTDA